MRAGSACADVVHRCLAVRMPASGERADRARGYPSAAVPLTAVNGSRAWTRMTVTVRGPFVMRSPALREVTAFEPGSVGVAASWKRGSLSLPNLPAVGVRHSSSQSSVLQEGGR
jgi:hypothetical protein